MDYEFPRQNLEKQSKGALRPGGGRKKGSGRERKEERKRKVRDATQERREAGTGWGVVAGVGSGAALT